jgi:hypothetical protein
MRKTWWVVLAVVLVLAGGGAWWFYHSLDSIVASAIRTYGPKITGVSVKLSSVKIQVTDGTAELRGLELGNPKGFHTEHALSVQKISMRLNVASVTKEVVLIEEISIVQPEITYEYASGTSNLDVIQRHVEAYVADKTGSKQATESPGTQKKIIIQNLYTKGATAKVAASALKGKVMTVPVPDVHLTDIGKKSGGATAGEVTRQILTAMNRSVTKSVSSLKPEALVDSVKKGTAVVGDTIKDWFK